MFCMLFLLLFAAEQICIVDLRYPLVEGRNEAEEMRLIGYEIDRGVVELIGDGGSGRRGEIEGYFFGGDQTWSIKIKAYQGTIGVRYALLVNYEEVASWVMEPIKHGKKIELETGELKLPTPCIITVQAIGDKPEQCYLDYVKITKVKKKE